MAETKFAEVIFETGSKSVVSYDSLDELKEGLAEQHRRATSGESGGPTGHPAERVKEVLLYDEHPGDYLESGLLSADDVKKALPRAIDELSMGGQVSVWELISHIRGMVSPLTLATDTGPHDSMYVVKETDSLPLDFLSEGGK